MSLCIITGGQTGVDRGAWLGAVDVGFEVSGFMPHNMRDEIGLIPFEIRKTLVPYTVPGLASRTTGNVETAHALLVIAPLIGVFTPGTTHTLEIARLNNVPINTLTTEGDMSLIDTVAEFVTRHMREVANRPFKLMVAGPRASKWPEGEKVAASVIRSLAHHLKV